MQASNTYQHRTRLIRRLGGRVVGNAGNADRLDCLVPFRPESFHA
jgi:hypothetical protein